MGIICAYCKSDDKVPPADNRIAPDTYLCDPCLARWFSNTTERTHMEAVIMESMIVEDQRAAIPIEGAFSKVRNFILEAFDKYMMGKEGIKP